MYIILEYTMLMNQYQKSVLKNDHSFWGFYLMIHLCCFYVI